MTTQAYTLEDFVADVDRIVKAGLGPEETTADVERQLALLIKNPVCVPAQFRTPPPEALGRYMLHRSPEFTVSAVVWAPGDTESAHDHETWGVVGVVENEMQETRYRLVEGDRYSGEAKIEVTEVHRMRPGDVSRFVSPNDIHAMENVTDKTTIEIHVYGRDLVGVHRHRFQPDGTIEPKISPPYLNC